MEINVTNGGRLSIRTMYRPNENKESDCFQFDPNIVGPGADCYLGKDREVVVRNKTSW